MGTAFDQMGEKCLTRYYEMKLEKGERLNRKDQEALENRRLLFDFMTSAGFTNYHEEWWHYDYGNQFWGKIKDENAIYSYITPTPMQNHKKD
jgi:D-alanyl-D-alanine dipeptidase